MSGPSFHDVTNIEITEPTYANGHSWSTIIISHRVSGRDESGEYAEVETKTQIACHHKDLVVATVKVGS